MSVIMTYSLLNNMTSTVASSSMTSSLSASNDVSSTSEAVGGTTSLPAVTTDDSVNFVNMSTVENPFGTIKNVDRFLQQMNDDFTMLVLPAIVFLGILFVVGVTGNSMVLYVYNRKLQKGTIRWFVQALAVFDLLSCLVAIPGEIIDMRNNYTFGSSPMCKVLRSVSMFCTVASGMTLMVVAVERYKRICTPLRKQITPKGAQVIITVSTVAASICAAPACIIYGPQTVPTDHPAINGTDCSTADVFIGTVIPLAFSTFQLLLFVLGALGLIVLYSLIGRKVWSHDHFRKAGFNAGINRRMSFFFNGSECSSPTTEDMVFTFPIKKNVPAAVEDNSNTSQGNNDTNDNNNVQIKAEKVASAEEPALEVEQKSMYQKPSDDTTLPDIKNHLHTDGHLEIETQIPPKDLSQSFRRQVSLEQPSSPTDFSHTMDTFKRAKAASKSASRNRSKSGDSSGLRGRYQRRPKQNTQSDMRRFLHRSESLTSGTRRTTLMLFLITLVYLLSFLPYVVLVIVKVLDEESLSGRGGGWELAHNILLRSYFINSMANPIIYSFCSRTFRKECSKVLHCKSCKPPTFVR